LAESYEIEVFTQNSIYNKVNNKISNKRKLKVYFSLPEKGVNEDTGVLLFIAGFGGQATSNVYKKMRDKFSDLYNLVTVQCDYFGYEFMQSAESIKIPSIDKGKLGKVFSAQEIEEIYKSDHFDFNLLLKYGSKYDINIDVNADLSKENLNNFNDMGTMQSIDNIVAVLNVINILYDNNLNINAKKIIIYGHSHGAYLAYLCNAFSPKLFSLIIDNSAWLYPVYLFNGDRQFTSKIGNLTLNTSFNYFAKKLINDFEIFSLPYLYSKFKNECKIISYHGVTDTLISNNDKKDFCKKVENCIYNEIDNEKIDNIIFKSTNHGLDSDFIELFNYTMNNFKVKFEKNTCIDLQNEIMFTTSKHNYVVDYKNIFPNISIK